MVGTDVAVKFLLVQSADNAADVQRAAIGGMRNLVELTLTRKLDVADVRKSNTVAKAVDHADQIVVRIGAQ